MENKKELATTYSPKEFEDRIYKKWEEKKYFTPKIDKTKNIPTPKPTKIIINLLPTWSAKTDKSGSAIVIKNPSKNATPASNPSLRFFARPAPTLVPIGVIARSAPKLNNPIPKINKIVDIKNVTISNVEKSVRLVQNKTITIANIGKTDMAASLIFSNKLLNLISPFHKISL